MSLGAVLLYMRKKLWIIIFSIYFNYYYIFSNLIFYETKIFRSKVAQSYFFIHLANSWKSILEEVPTR